MILLTNVPQQPATDWTIRRYNWNWRWSPVRGG
jgi:hypothetical protein